jgi:NAD(P)-binding Rossmann-like domain
MYVFVPVFCLFACATILSKNVFHLFLLKAFIMATHPHRVAIVGAGAAGLSAAYALSNHPDKFSVTVFEKVPVPGDMASSMDIDCERYGASFINDSVQGCSPAFANTLHILRDFQFEPEEVDMRCASSTFSWFTSSPICFLFSFPPPAKKKTVCVNSGRF